MENKKMKYVAAALGGAAVGAVLSMLFAPEKGTKTRKQIVNEFDELKDTVCAKLNKLTETADAIKSSVKEYIK